MRSESREESEWFEEDAMDAAAAEAVAKGFRKTFAGN